MNLNSGLVYLKTPKLETSIRSRSNDDSSTSQGNKRVEKKKNNKNKTMNTNTNKTQEYSSTAQIINDEMLEAESVNDTNKYTQSQKNRLKVQVPPMLDQSEFRFDDSISLPSIQITDRTDKFNTPSAASALPSSYKKQITPVSHQQVFLLFSS